MSRPRPAWFFLATAPRGGCLAVGDPTRHRSASSGDEVLHPIGESVVRGRHAVKGRIASERGDDLRAQDGSEGRALSPRLVGMPDVGARRGIALLVVVDDELRVLLCVGRKRITESTPQHRPNAKSCSVVIFCRGNESTSYVASAAVIARTQRSSSGRARSTPVTSAPRKTPTSRTKIGESVATMTNPSYDAVRARERRAGARPVGMQSPRRGRRRRRAGTLSWASFRACGAIHSVTATTAAVQLDDRNAQLQ